MTTCQKVCEEIIEAGEKAAARPWQNGYTIDGIFCHPYSEYDVTFLGEMKKLCDESFVILAANNADRLARMVLAMARDYPDAQGRLDRMWEQSK